MLNVGTVAFALGILWSIVPATAADETRCAIVAGLSEAQMQSLYLATAQKPAQIQIEGKASSTSNATLELTVRPRAEDPDTPFLVQVFGPTDCTANGVSSGSLLGTFALEPLRIGREQKLVMPAPSGSVLSGADTQVTLKLIPANSARTLQNSAIEILGAQVIN